MVGTKMLIYWLLIGSISTCTSTPTNSDVSLNNIGDNDSPFVERQIREMVDRAVKKQLTSIEESLNNKSKTLDETVEKLNKLEQELNDKTEKLNQAQTTINRLEGAVTVIHNTSLQSDAVRKTLEVGAQQVEQAIRNLSKLETEIQECKDTIINLQNYKQSEEKFTTPTNINFQYKGRPNRDVPIGTIIPEGNDSAVHHLLKLLVRSSCHHWRQSGFSDSGYYLVDPDGRGVGQLPFLVYCDMVTGFTFVHHDAEGTQDVHACSGPGCYQKTIKYNATQEQILALMKVSESCQQFVKLECRQTPLQKDGELVSWWVDRHGDRHYYWSGDTDDLHTCNCGLSRACVDPRHVCNCNADVGDVLVTDHGYITNNTALPVTELHFGDTSGSNRDLKYMLGPLRCFGERHLEFPESCEDMWVAGNKYSGYYFLGKDDNIRLQYCNMGRLADRDWDTEMSDITSGPPPLLLLSSLLNDVRSTQTSISTISKHLSKMNDDLDLLRTAVIFNAVRTTHKSDPGTYIVFDKVTINIGDGYNSATGIFTAPISGVYLFSANSDKQLNSDARITLRKNGHSITWAYSHSGVRRNTFGSTVITDLMEGDEVAVFLHHGKIYGHGGPTNEGVTLFLGVLLHA